MRHILQIVFSDFRRLTSSVVAIVVLLGLCVVPCLYAWFNIFSNWDPYEPESTGRIKVAVASDDKGAELLGVKINVGEKIQDALAANDSIGWVMVKSGKQAEKGVRAGDYYAALIVPEDFSQNVMSFTAGELKHPKLKYLENEKLNAIAPKITGKAKSAVQEEVDQAFIETLAKYVSEAAVAADNAGLEPGAVFADLAERMDDLDRDLGQCSAVITSAAQLSDAASDLIKVSDGLIGSAKDSLSSEKQLADQAEIAAPEKSENGSASKSVENASSAITGDLAKIRSDVAAASKDMDAWNSFAGEKLKKEKDAVDKIRAKTDSVAANLRKLGLTVLAEKFESVSGKLAAISGKLGSMEKATEETWPEIKAAAEDLVKEIDEAKAEAGSIKAEVSADIDKKVNKAVADANNAISNVSDSLGDAYGDLSALSGALGEAQASLGHLRSGLDGTAETIGTMRQGLSALSMMFNAIAGSDALDDVNALLTSDPEKIADFISQPVGMKTETIYPVANYGSAMAPFYTVLAQWVGALLAAVLISSKVRRKQGLGKLKLYESFFGRYRLFLFIGLAQALIVSLGDLLYAGIQCEHPGLFVLAACVNGICFTMINYALVFALDNIGLGLGVIVLVMQVAGAGGTYPVEVLPPVFRVLNPAMPFKYAMDAMKECVCGMYGDTYVKSIAVLGAFTLIAMAFGLLLYYPALRLNRMIAISMKKSDVMLG